MPSYERGDAGAMSSAESHSERDQDTIDYGASEPEYLERLSKPNFLKVLLALVEPS